MTEPLASVIPDRSNRVALTIAFPNKIWERGKGLFAISVAWLLTSLFCAAHEAPPAQSGQLTQNDLTYFFDSITEKDGMIVFVASHDATGMKWEVETLKAKSPGLTHKGEVSTSSGITHEGDIFTIPEDWGCLRLKKTNLVLLCYAAPGSFYAARLIAESGEGGLPEYERDCLLKRDPDRRFRSAPWPDFSM